MSLKMYVQVLRNTLISLPAVASYLQQPLKFTLIFFVLSYLWLGLVAAVRITLIDIPQLQSQLSQSLDEVVTRFPNDLQIEWQNQHLTHSQSEPLSIPYPSFIEASSNSRPPVLAYHLNQELQPEDFSRTLPGQSWLVITPTRLYINNLAGKWNAYPLTQLPGFENNFNITKDNLPSLAEQAKSLIQSTIRWLSLGLMIFVPGSLMLYRLWTALIETLLVYFLVRLSFLPLSLAKSFQLTLHLFVICEIVVQAAELIYGTLNLSLFGLTFWVVFTLLALTQRQQLRQVIAKR